MNEKIRQLAIKRTKQKISQHNACGGPYESNDIKYLNSGDPTYLKDANEILGIVLDLIKEGYKELPECFNGFEWLEGKLK